MNQRAHQRRVARNRSRLHSLISDHGRIAFTIDREYRHHQLHTLSSPAEVFDFPLPTDHYVVRVGLAENAAVLDFALAAYERAVDAGDVFQPADRRAPHAFIGACCEHIRDEMANLLGELIPQDVIDAFPDYPTGWLCWLIAPGAEPQTEE